MMLFRLLAVAAMGMVGFAAQAQEAVRCDTCLTDTQFKERAVLMEAITNAGGTYYVYNLKDNLVQRWHIPAGSGGTPPGGGIQPRSISHAASAAAAGRSEKQAVPGAVTTEVQKGHTLYVIGGNSIRPLYNVPVSVLNLNATYGKSTYDILRDNNLKAQIESALGANEIVNKIVNKDVLASLVDIAQMSTNYLGLKEGSALMFRLVMEDGTYIDLRLDVAETTADTQENTARTASGQLIPENIQQVDGNWTYSPVDNLGKLADHMGQLGAKVTFVGTGNVIRAISCSHTTCIIEKYVQ